MNRALCRTGANDAVARASTLKFPLACIAVVVAVIVSGCATPPPINPERQETPTHDEYRYVVVEDNASRHLKNTFLAATFSGGGMRAAALAYGALQALRDTTVTVWAPGPKGAMQPMRVPLINEVDFVSSVSGGSVTAAYWALHGPDRLAGLERQFLLKNIQRQLVLTTFLSPPSWFRLPTPGYSRLDVLSNKLDSKLFDNDAAGPITYKDLIEKTKHEKHRPYLVINATDMTTGSLFPFIQLQFDLLCSDLNGFRIADAVAASAAYPVLLPALTLTNHRSDNPSCLDQALEQQWRLPLERKRLFVEDLKAQLERARDQLNHQRGVLRQAEENVRTRELAVERADERVRVADSEVTRATDRVDAIKVEVDLADRQVRALSGELRRAQNQEARRRQERNHVEWTERRKKEERQRAAAQVEDQIRQLKEELKRVQDTAEEESFIEWLGEMFRSLLPGSEAERESDRERPDDLSQPPREEARQPDDSTELREPSGDGRDQPSFLAKVGETMQGLWISWTSRKARTQPQEPTVPVPAGRQSELGSPDEESQEAASRLPDEPESTLAELQQRLQQLEAEYRESATQVQGLIEWKDVREQELPGLEEVIARQRALKESLNSIGSGLESLEQDAGAMKQDTEVQEEDAPPVEAEPPDQLPVEQDEQDTQRGVVQILAELQDAQNQLAAQFERIAELKREQIRKDWELVEQKLEKELDEMERRLQELEAQHAEEERMGEAILEEKEAALTLAKRRVEELKSDLAEAATILTALRQRREQLQGQVSDRTTELRQAKEEAAGQRLALQRAESVVGKQERKLRQENALVKEWEKYVRRVETLQNEHDIAARYYDTQIAHYGHEDTEFVHLFDGGTADNLGFTPLLELLDSLFPAESKNGSNEAWRKATRRVGIIAVDARNSPPRDYETRHAAPNMLNTLFTTIGTAIDSKSFLLGKELQRVTAELETDDVIDEKFIVEVAFENITDFHAHAGAHGHSHSRAGQGSHIHDHDPEDRDLRLDHQQAHRTPEYASLEDCKRTFQQIGTNWKLSDTEIGGLIEMGKALVRNSQPFAELIGRYEGKMPPGGDTVATVCARYQPMLANGTSPTTSAEGPSRPGGN